MATIKLDRERELKLGMRALYNVEKKMGKKISKIDMEDIGIEEMAVLLWAGLQSDDKSLTVEKVLDLVDQYATLQDVGAAIGKALEEAFGYADEDDEKNGMTAAENGL